MQSTKHHSSSKGAEAAAQKLPDGTRDAKSKKVASSSGSRHKTDERDRHRSKETVCYERMHIHLHTHTCTYKHTDTQTHT